jgi:hypothetical protein
VASFDANFTNTAPAVSTNNTRKSTESTSHPQKKRKLSPTVVSEKGLKPGGHKVKWREEEDAIVIRYIAQSAEPTFTQWADLAPRLPGKSGKQIRDRWINYLNPAINHLPFSREDDLLLWEGHKKLGKRWVEISDKVFNSSRPENHIKNRWYSAAFKKFIADEFGPNAYVDAKAAEV